MIFIGTSGFSYKEWKGAFYPKELPAKQYLSFYAQHFKTTEINNTFYRIPTEQNIAAWYGEVPADFSFTLKLNQKITHMKRLKNTDEEMERFLEVAAVMKEKLGTILVQLPPYAKKDAASLATFLSQYASRARLAFEFRHESWFDAETYALLKEHQSALAVVEGEDQEPVREITGTFIYMRLRKEDYTQEELKQWSKWIKEQTVDVYCYLKHDDKAPILAQQLMDLL